MSITRDREEIDNGVVQLRFADIEGHANEISAADLAEVLAGLVQFTSELSKTGEFGDGVPPIVRVRAPKEGSFVLEALLWVQENPLTGAGLAAGGVAGGVFLKSAATNAGKIVTDSIAAGVRSLRGVEVTDYVYQDNGEVKVQWADGVVSELRKETWDKLKQMKRPTRQALGKLLAPLNKPGAKLEVRDAAITETTEEILKTEAEATATTGDYLIAITDPDESYETERIFEAEAKIGSIDFANSSSWRVETTEGKRKATIEDREFLLSLDRGFAIHKNDIFRVKIRETVKKENGKNASTEWAVIEVTRTKRGDTDGTDSSASSPENA